MTFELHPKLADDTLEVTELPLCHVRLMDDATYPWLVLVPAVEDLRDLHDLPEDKDAVLMAEIRAASNALRQLHQPDKINVAALGNQVPQLHIHVIARLTSDPAWPGPIWGKVPAQPYAPDVIGETVDELAAILDYAAG